MRLSISIYNIFVSLKNSIEEALATMDVYLKKRYDLIPNLVETVKGYAKHESETLEKVITARNIAVNAKNIDESIQGENMLQGTLKSLFALAESYPDLKANDNFIQLQRQLESTENDIANSRKYYNAVVKTYNIKIEIFPNIIIARMFNFTKKKMFEIKNSVEKENVSVKF